MWCSPFSANTQKSLVSEYALQGNTNTNNLELAALLAQLQLLAPHVAPLSHIRTVVDNTAEQGWANRGSVKSLSVVGRIFQEIALLTHQWHLYTSIGRVRGKDIKMADATSRLTNLSDRLFLRHFNLNIPQ